MKTAKSALVSLAVVLLVASTSTSAEKLSSPSFRGLEESTTETGEEEKETCELQPRCEKLGGKCLPKDECLRMGSEYRWIAPHQEFCGLDASASSGCGCCFVKKDETMTEKRLLETVAEHETNLKPRLVMTGGGLNLNLGPDGVGRLSLTGLGFNLDGSPGEWSFASTPSGKETPTPECDDRQCFIKVRGFLHSPKVDDVVEPTKLEDGVFASEMTEAIVEVAFDNTEGNDDVQAMLKDENDLSRMVKVRFAGSARIEVVNTHQSVAALLKEDGVPSSLELMDLTGIWTRYDPLWPVPPVIIWPFPLQEENYQLCVQPVRIRQRSCSGWDFLGLCIGGSYTYTYSGAGLNFGRPGANLQWGKVDLSFYWKDWVTINDNSGKYAVVTESEEASLRSEVNDPSCVEVFFVPKFSPSSLHGGGACWGSGTASAKIITSDEMVSCGVDETHLAHELGHAVGIMHPNTGHATLADGSTGTLMCGSGWERDNPRRNSRDNGENMQNPLLACYMDTMDWGHDCIDSSSCGSCAANMPSDSC
ncbi:Hypothetical Protein FCC1311_092442 [Hondaea fermentalgiana]|uniref:Peptidase M12B domain-containing protein n=1 Tax=Hondaea fermentalgiana TaxID=2315210 RepID=A0A2R5GQ90_9STRA|nr:Hypothetical Protein FCC1311_092442 [Hondaea fermentalgiana]|eukprot:GBG33020.1 Hypothetical Protein FCC1311_092442 [Hondaea fermentalgiana]